MSDGRAVGEEPIRWGILGAGGIAATVGDDIAATPGNVLVAVAARDLDRAQAFAHRHRVERAYGSYDELVADPDVDVVYIATTHAQHRDVALLALRAGKPVLVEKAFTLNAAQAREVVDEARASGVFCMEAMWTRFNPLIRRARELALGGAIGDIVSVRADLSKLFPYSPDHRLYDLSAGGGALLDLGVYPVTVAYLFLGRPDSIQALATLAPTGADITVLQQWGYDDGRLAQLYCSAAGPSPFGALINGTGGTIGIEPRVHRPARLVVRTDDGEQVITTNPAPGNGYQAQVAEVARCLRAGELESPDVPLDETVEIMTVLDDVRRQIGVRYPADG